MSLSFRFIALLALVVCLVLLVNCENKKDTNGLQIGIKKKVDPKDCPIKSRKGDDITVHYKGELQDGTQFDASYDRGEPFRIKLGVGQVIKGWDQGLLNMCEGEHRKLIIPPELGYGSRGSGAKIPPDSVLVFHVEMIKISRPDEL